MISYVSTAKPELSQEEIDMILSQAVESNNALSICGFLLYSEGHFFQVIEGEKEQIIKLFSKVKKDPRHRDVISFVEKSISKPSYDHYTTDRIKDEKNFRQSELQKHLIHLEGLDEKTRATVKKVLDIFII